MTAAITCVYQIIVLFVAIAQADLPSVDPSKYKDIRGQVCFRSALLIQKELNSYGPNLFKDFPKKPATVSSNSPCFGMRATCCTTEKEEEIMHLVTADYNSRLQTAFDKRAQSCKITGRNIERAIYANLKESIDLFKKEVSGILRTNLSQDLFKEFADYLYKFVYTRDFCPLRETIANQIKKLFRYAYQLRQVEDPSLYEINNAECLANLEDYYISVWQNGTLQNLMQSLNNIRLISESFDLIKSLVTDIRGHRWSRECTLALFTIKHCAYCAGYKNFYPCDGNCLNALHGCTADMAELDKHIHQLSEYLLKISRLVQLELRPIKLLKTVLFDYVKLVHQLAHDNFTEMVNATSCQIDEEKEESYLQQIQNIKSLQYVPITTGTVSNNVIQSAIQSDLKCFKDMESLLVQLPEEMCRIDPKHFAYIRRNECWNGTAARASYMHPIVGPYKVDQITNPSYKHNPLPLYNNTFHKQITNIHQLITDMNRTLDYYQCFERDDEDCSTKFVLRCENKLPTITTTYIGSGSGSGSGYEIITIRGDLEKQKGSPFIIELGGKRKFDDSSDADEDDVEKTTPTIATPTRTTSKLLSETKEIKLTQTTTPIQATPLNSKSQVKLSSKTSSIVRATPPVITLLPEKPVIIIDVSLKQGSPHSCSPLLLLVVAMLLSALYMVLL